MTLSKLNNAEPDQAYLLFESCCCAPNWVKQMVQSRPFSDAQSLFNQAQTVWDSLQDSDFLAAFEGHPQIGDLSTLQKKYASTSDTAGHEQAGMSVAKQDVLQQMADLNKEYLSRFGFIFIVCASGKSAEQMLELIQSRINNPPEVELQVAAQEQAKITQIRLEKLL
ncbi:2-oxo-4-hydroxy-4-carboxy-5-ureidoimidazoline decarboxylase [Paraglaciecola aquimarina]|uniref:2-oxo-4-hydroxy-4-carboxy-5-ureidoimidazoline decarboxylase n=1 Tax=Paraglaciecola aquimarina TaxID=1235557 RepID=A0ABU3SYF6_9ALTE|nr:2-oxo-4-hydroxy-4-carboxy-5-ureidoimidazoline decarboxylase [Paraglaciecola aquimarina]MDU0355050.1 2-oxo-4-hydroxy-4-carboxy-5-ureidoimidazoline decarboxylase [Paraglaciecola aquimarina]